MSRRSLYIKIATKAGILFGALFLVTVLIAAIPAHQQKALEVVIAPAQQPAQDSAAQAPPSSPSADHSSMSGMSMDEKVSERAAVSDMTPGPHDAHSQHMYMTTMRDRTPEDVARAGEIVTKLRAGIEKYKDYHVALNEGFRIFMPNVPQPEYHFTSYKNGFLEAFTFDPARPTSLLYKKTSTGYELVGAMYTMPKRATEDQLNERVPLSVAMWHLHTNLCLPARGQFQNADWTKFGLHGTIVSKDACGAAGGRFSPVIFGWMVHVYPYEDSLDKIFAMHMHKD
ncbi:MAG TPA: hypothetical protein VMP12_08430 [Candidatus Sulfotelmatobacter sp.]|nr:hypothetical protein [Candidatus Sulfotelmatobacter sp.]